MSDTITQSQVDELTRLIKESLPGKLKISRTDVNGNNKQFDTVDHGGYVKIYVVNANGDHELVAADVQYDDVFDVAMAESIVMGRNLLHALLAERERMQAVIDKLPRTTDDVAITPDSTVWYVGSQGPREYAVRMYRDIGGDLTTDFGLCYSTRAAAEAAQHAQQEHP